MPSPPVYSVDAVTLAKPRLVVWAIAVAPPPPSSFRVVHLKIREVRANECAGLASSNWGDAITLSAEVLEAKPLADVANGARPVTRTIAGRDPLDLDAEACVIGGTGFEEGHGASLAFIGSRVDSN